jgi:hypothetical protein
VSDRDDIIETQIGYADAADSRDWSILDRVFTADATGDYGTWNPSSRADFAAMLAAFLGGAGPTQHLLGNHVVGVTGDTATARCAIRAFHAGRPGSGREADTYTVIGTYHDRLVRTPDGWRIAHRRMQVDAQLGDPSILGPG